MRYIKCGVNNEFASGAGQVIGAAGSHHDVALRITFGEMWDGLSMYVTFRDALGENPTIVQILPTNLVLGTERTYDVVVPAAPKAKQGKAMVTVQGYTVVGGTQEATATNTATAYFIVLPSDYALADDESIDATIAQQLQAEIDEIGETVTDARLAAKDAEAWAVGQIEGADVPETDTRYENNSKYYAQRADESATEAYGYASAAFGSASSASGSATAAAGSAAAATDSATAAATSASAAAGSATGAATSADNAAGSATAAAGSATAAATSASAAAGSEANAAGSETAAQESADYVAEQMTKWNQKADQTTVNLLVKSVTFNAETGVFTFTREDGSYTTIDTALEKVATNWQYDADTQSLVLTLADGSTQRVPLSAFITETEFTDSAQIAFSVSNHLVTATVKSGSITEEMLSVAFMGTIRNYVSSAAGSATSAATSASAAAGSATGAATSAASAADSAEDSEAWAVGQRGGTDVPSTDETYHNNAKYWAAEAQHAAQGGVSSFNGRSGSVEPQQGDYTAAMVGARPDTWIPTAAQVGADASGAAAAVQENLTAHANNTTIHITAEERTAWTAKANPSDIPNASSSAPVMDGAASAGSSADYTRADHVHPTDTSRAPTNHASSSSTYGVGSDTDYGHLKLSASTSSTSGVSSGVAATPSAVKSAYDLANTANTAAGNAASAASSAVSAAAAAQSTANAKSAKALAFTVTLSASGWSNNAQTVSSASFIVSGYSYVVSPASASLEAYAEAQIYADDVTTAGQMTFHCGEVPSDALTVSVLRVEVS